MKINIEIDEFQLKRLIMDHLTRQLGEIPITLDRIKIEVKSKQNYKSEWEQASFRATYNNVS